MRTKGYHGRDGSAQDRQGQLVHIDSSSVGLSGKLPFGLIKYAEINLNKQANKKASHHHDRCSPKGRIFIGSRKIKHYPEKRAPVRLPALDILAHWQVGGFRQTCQPSPKCQSINSLRPDFVMNKEPSGIDFLSQKSILPERDCADQPTSGFLSLGGFVSRCKLINCISGLAISLL